MRRQSEDLSVYAFGEEDDAVDRAENATVLKFGKRTRNPSPDEEETVDFLGFFAGRKRLNRSIDPSESESAASENTPLMEGILVSSGNRHNEGYAKNNAGNLIHNGFAGVPIEMTPATLTLQVPGSSQRGDALTECASDINQSFTDSDHSEGPISSGSSYRTSEDKENEGSFDPLNLADWRGANMDFDAVVSVMPDYVVYQNELYAESQLTFSVDSIRIQCSDANRRDEPLVFEWSIADLLLICCCWIGTMETAYIQVQLKEADLNLTTKENGSSHSGLIRLAFTVCGSEWLRKQKNIWSLTPKYKDLWKTELDMSGDSLLCNVENFTPYYPTEKISLIEDTLGDVVYPEGDPDAVSISRRDIELLRPETFINDTIIDFYIKYLLDKISKNERSRFHFFNSFFFRKLADLDKDPKNALGGRAAFLRVRKWTRKVNIFEKAYIFIPVNFNLHWSLLVICHPGEVVNAKDEDVNKALRVPCILHMDSIKGNHTGLKDLIRSYLWEEWKERHSDWTEDISSSFLNLRFVQLELPQQENYFDCGLFLLHYVELFLKAAPVNFNPFKITSFCNFLSADWFIPAEASFKRFLIRNLLYEVLGNTNQNTPSHPSSRNDPSVCSTNIVDKDVELLPQEDMAPATGLDGTFSDAGGSRIELELFKGSSINGDMLPNDQLEQQLLEPKAVAGLCNHRNDDFSFELAPTVSLSKCLMPVIMEDQEDHGQPETWQASIRALNATADGTCSTSFASGEPDDELAVLGSPEGLAQIEEQEKSVKEDESKLSDKNDDAMPFPISEIGCSSAQEEFIFISSDDYEHRVSGSEVAHNQYVGDDRAIDPISVVEPNSEEDKVEPLTTTISEIPETGIVKDSQGHDITDAVSLGDDENVISPLPMECKVVADSPDRRPMLIDGREEIPQAMDTVHASTDTFLDAGDSLKDIKIQNDDRTDETSHNVAICDEQQNPNEACHDTVPVNLRNSSEASPDVVVIGKQQQRKRQKNPQPGIQRKQTRSSTRS